MTVRSYSTFQDAYVSILTKVVKEPEYLNAPRGFASREIVGVTFRILDPVDRLIRIPARRTNLVFNFAEALWYLAGSSSLDFVAYYASGMSVFSTDGVTLAGTAYGPRIFRFLDGTLNQWQQVLRILREDPDSKRAVIQIFDPKELTIENNIDVACTLALQFMIREGRLCTVAFMRANDAFRGAVSDVFSFTVIQELMARDLGVEVGTYTHSVGSYHVYDTDLIWAEAVIDGEIDSIARPNRKFPRMPEGDNWPHIAKVLEYEERMRTGHDSPSWESIESSELPEYWKQVASLFYIYRSIYRNEGVENPAVAQLPLIYLDALSTRWPDYFHSIQKS